MKDWTRDPWRLWLTAGWDLGWLLDAPANDGVQLRRVHRALQRHHCGGAASSPRSSASIEAAASAAHRALQRHHRGGADSPLRSSASIEAVAGAASSALPRASASDGEVPT